MSGQIFSTTKWYEKTIVLFVIFVLPCAAVALFILGMRWLGVFRFLESVRLWLVG